MYYWQNERPPDGPCMLDMQKLHDDSKIHIYSRAQLIITSKWWATQRLCTGAASEHCTHAEELLLCISLHLHATETVSSYAKQGQLTERSVWVCWGHAAKKAKQKLADCYQWDPPTDTGKGGRWRTLLPYTKKRNLPFDWISWSIIIQYRMSWCIVSPQKPTGAINMEKDKLQYVTEN